MMVTIQIDDRELRRLQDTLRITEAEYQDLCKNPGDLAKPHIIMALEARRALGMSEAAIDWVIDHKPEPYGFSGMP